MATRLKGLGIGLCALLICLPAVAGADLWRTHDAASNRQLDHGDWQLFLDRYVHASSDGINRVAYAKARADGWPELLRYLDDMAKVDPTALNKDAQMAFWINLYNALTVDVVLRHPGKSSIRRMGKGLFSFGPWDDEVITVLGEALTLNDIEHGILRPIWQDHRIHYAVNCASIGCPNLSRRAFTASNLNEQLNSAEKTYLTHPRAVQFDAGGRLQLSSIFDWYRDDFADSRAGLLAHLAERLPRQTALQDYEGRIRYEYDWALNALEPRLN